MRLDNKLEGCCGKVEKLRIKLLEKEMEIRFPRSFINFIENCDGGVPVACDFQYIDIFYSRNRIECIGSFLSLNFTRDNNLYSFWQTPSEFFPVGLIAFAENGGGDYICFDYRQGKDNLNPPIVYWNHEANIGKDVSFVANNFEEFLGMLKHPKEE